MGGEMNPL